LALTDNHAYGYALNEASGNFLDVLLSNDLTASGSPGSGTGKLGNCRTFNGSNQYASRADNATLSTGDIDWSVMAWINTASISGFPVLAHKGWPGGSANSEWVIYLNGGKPTLEVGFGTSTSTPLAHGTTLSNGTWYLLAAGHDSVNNQLWISLNAGTPVTQTHMPGVNDGTGDFVIGASVSQGLYWNGSIDEFHFFKRDIRSDLAAFYNSGAGDDTWYGGGGGSPKVGARRMHSSKLNRLSLVG